MPVTTDFAGLVATDFAGLIDALAGGLTRSPEGGSWSAAPPSSRTGIHARPWTWTSVQEIELYGQHGRILGLDLLERNKLAAGRAKDLLDIEAVGEIRKRR